MKRFAVCMLLAAGLVMLGCESQKKTTKSRYTDQTGRSYYQDNQPGEDQNIANAPSRVESFYKGEAGKSFYAMLAGSQEVPAVDTTATGTAMLQVSSDGARITYRITVNNLTNVSMGHIHWGQSGKSGPPVVDLPIKARQGPYTGLLVEGVITASDLTGPLSGKDLSALIDGFSKGDTYVNLHTQANPDGEIRGQVMAGQPEGTVSPKSTGTFNNRME